MHVRTLIATLVFGFLVTAPAWAGPPLICHPHSIGAARSLPWRATASWNGTDSSYDVSHLVTDTLNLLTPQTPTNVREETLRRAAIYSAQQHGLTIGLASRLLARMQRTPNDPTAWFDAGYFIETARVAARVFPAMDQQLPPINGLAFVRRAIALGGKNMEEAAVNVQVAQQNR